MGNRTHGPWFLYKLRARWCPLFFYWSPTWLLTGSMERRNCYLYFSIKESEVTQLLTSVSRFETGLSDLQSQHALSTPQDRLLFWGKADFAVGALYTSWEFICSNKYTVPSPWHCHHYVSWFLIFTWAVQIRHIMQKPAWAIYFLSTIKGV